MTHEPKPWPVRKIAKSVYIGLVKNAKWAQPWTCQKGWNQVLPDLQKNSKMVNSTNGKFKQYWTCGIVAKWAPHKSCHKRKKTKWVTPRTHQKKAKSTHNKPVEKSKMTPSWTCQKTTTSIHARPVKKQKNEPYTGLVRKWLNQPIPNLLTNGKMNEILDL